jgi:tRNA threonylcarbamoyladenosine biosynthesis protein TsaE
MPEQASGHIAQSVPEPGRPVHVLTTHNPFETQAIGEALAAAIRPGQVIALRGVLGTGKTTFVQGLARGLGVRSQVSSPTFVLVNEYTGTHGVRLAHIDTYRLGTSVRGEAEGIGLEELLEDGDGVVAIEWADRVQELLPADYLLVELGYGEDEEERVIRISAIGITSAAALEKLDFQGAFTASASA